VRMTFGYAEPAEAAHPRGKMLAEPDHHDRAPCSGRQRSVGPGDGGTAAKDRVA
jgi:hypothetical protein